MPRIDETAECPPPSPSRLNAIAGECAKEAHSRDVSYIDHAPDNQVVLSQRLEQLCRRVGGCQTDELLAVVRRVMYETLRR